MAGAPTPDDPSQIVPAGNGTVADAAAAYDVLLGGPEFAVAHSAIHPVGHREIQHSNPTHFERPAASVFPGGPAGDAGVRGRGIRPHPPFTTGNPLRRGQRK